MLVSAEYSGEQHINRAKAITLRLRSASKFNSENNVRDMCFNSVVYTATKPIK